MMRGLLAVTPSGRPLGLRGMKTLVCGKGGFGKKRQRKTRLFRDKERVKRLEGIGHPAARKACCGETRFVRVGDRECDLYDIFVPERPVGVDWLIRAAGNRGTRHPELYLWEVVRATTPLGNAELLVPARDNVAQPQRA
jgi:hypothetical protein